MIQELKIVLDEEPIEGGNGVGTTRFRVEHTFSVNSNVNIFLNKYGNKFSRKEFSYFGVLPLIFEMGF